MNLILNCLALSVLLIVLQSGCSNIGKRPTQVTILDQGYRTGGASEATLGSYGLLLGQGFSFQPNLFEREGFDGDLVDKVPLTERAILDSETTRRVVAEAGADYSGVEAEVERARSEDVKIALLIVDLDKESLVKKINSRPDVLRRFRQSEQYRIVTATASLTAVSSATFSSLLSGSARTSEAIGSLTAATGSLGVDASSTVRVQPGNVFAYQISQPVWDREGPGRLVRYLLTDRFFWGERKAVKLLENKPLP